jgi:hypothetical protein
MTDEKDEKKNVENKNNEANPNLRVLSSEGDSGEKIWLTNIDVKKTQEAILNFLTQFTDPEMKEVG